MQPSRRHAAGLSLIELLCVIAILAVLAGTALPAFGRLAEATRTRGARQTMMVSLNEARMLAVARQAHVVVCPSRDLRTCSAETHWEHGWIVFVDRDRDGSLGDADQLLSVAQAQPDGIAILSSAGRRSVGYRPDGSASGTNLTLTFCDRRGPAHASTLVVSNPGRIRSGTPTEAQAAGACGATAS